MTRHVFTDDLGIVVQVIVGDLDADQVADFLRSYSVFFGATSVLKITDAEASVWIGGSYDSTSGVFSPPPPPEPEPEPIAEIVEETTNDDAPII
jgi:hypothetical protein